VDFSLFYFGDDTPDTHGKYRLLLDGARFADAAGFAAVWTPERHFHTFGGLYPNPSVTSAAVAAVTQRISVRAGSVVAPLHHPFRIAEEWAAVDNISGGRAGVSFASGWHVNDFALRPESYGDRKLALTNAVVTVRELWRGEAVEVADGAGNPFPARLHPLPVQRSLPMWLTSAGSTDSFSLAGSLGVGVLTHLLGQKASALAEKIRVYRNEWRRFEPDGHERPHVALMMHAFLGESVDAVRETVREPFVSYLKNSFNLLSRSAPGGPDTSSLSASGVDFVVRRSFEHYFKKNGLFGTIADAVRKVEMLAAIGVDEIACLIDFGVEPETVLRHLDYLAELKKLTQ